MLNATKNHEIMMKDKDKWRCCLNVMGVVDDITRRNGSNASINVLDNDAIVDAGHILGRGLCLQDCKKM